MLLTHPASSPPLSLVADFAVCKGEVKAVTSFGSTMSNLAVFVFSFTCHQNIFSVCNEISNRTQTKVDSVIFLSIGTALALYLAVAWSGLLTFGDSLQSDILLNYPQSALVTTMRVFVALLVLFSYPLQLDPSRRCITTLIKKVAGEAGDGAGADREGDAKESGECRKYVSVMAAVASSNARRHHS